MAITHTTTTSLLPVMMGAHRARLGLDFAAGKVTFSIGDNATHAVVVAHIESAAVINRWVFADIKMVVGSNSFTFKGFTKAAAADFVHAILLRQSLPATLAMATSIQSALARVTEHPHYLSQPRFDALSPVVPAGIDQLVADLTIAIANGYTHHGPVDLALLLQDIQSFQTGAARDRHNQRILTAHKQQFASLFQTVEKTPLSDEQIQAVLINESRNLVVASAGSGKTSTIVGKVGYLVASGHTRPQEILTLAFAKDAAAELNHRLRTRLAAFVAEEEIKASTFHALGLDVIGLATGIRPDVCSSPDVMIDRCISDLRSRDTRFNRQWTLFQALYNRSIQVLPEFASEDTYHSYLKACGARRKAGEELRIPTLQGDMVASMEEVMIANWLFCKGIQYEYERPYPYMTADHQRRQYHPDFYFPQADIYLEHLGIDDNGKPAPFLGQAYIDSIKWKRDLHRANGTRLYETTSGMVRSGEVFDALTRIIDAHSIKASPRSTQDIEKALSDNNLKVQSNQRLVATFIHHLKSNELTVDAVRKGADSQGKREQLFLDIVDAVLTEYTTRLRDLHQVDFDDMIILATQHIRAGQVKLPFKVIIVDEFQDLASSRANLIKAMLAQHQDSMLFAVGDDWQAIYRFAGSDISAMTRFKEQFGAPSVTRLTKTYRCNQGITDVSSAFIQRNPAQIKKTVSAVSGDKEGVIEVVRFEQHSLLVDAIFGKISELIASANRRPDVFILCRYNREMELFLTSPYLTDLGRAANIRVMSFHSSKGLEADYVFIPSLSGGVFPSTIEDDPLLSLVMPVPETFTLAEERRVFYVALTRARHKVFAYADARNESPFLLEMEKLAKPGVLKREILDSKGVIIRAAVIAWCKRCSGYMVPRTGKFGPFKGCSKYPECTHTIDQAS